MPREQIVPLKLAQVDNDPKADTPVFGQAWMPPGIHIGWNPTGEHGEGHVQVMIEADPRYIAFAAAQEDDTATVRVWSDGLTRTELNKLIRSLRNARDKAFGRDE